MPPARPLAPRLAELGFALAFALSAGCIERPWAEAPVRAAVDRSALADVLVSSTPKDLTPVGALFGNAAELVGYRMEPAQMVPGHRVTLTLFWRAKAELDPWHIFVHLDDSQGSGQRIHAEHDPAGGRYPTEVWRPGDLIADSIQFTAPRWPLLLYLGFYSTGETRLQLNSPGRGRADTNNRLLAGVLPLAK